MTFYHPLPSAADPSTRMRNPVPCNGWDGGKINRDSDLGCLSFSSPLVDLILCEWELNLMLCIRCHQFECHLGHTFSYLFVY